VTSVVKIEKGEVIYFKAFLLSRSDVVLQEVKSQYESFRAKSNGYTIVGYTSGNIVINSDELKPMINDILYEIRKHKLNFDMVIGSDEAGKGEWLGPMVVAAVAANQEQIYELQAHGVMDSKELSLTRIRKLASVIRDHHYLRRHVIITPRRFNELYSRLKNERKTLNDLLAWGHAKVIDELLASLLGEEKKVRVVIDEFDRIKTEERLQRVLNLAQIEVIQRPKGEENIAVAAASIIARDMREDYIDFLCKKLRKDLRTLTVEDVVADERANEYAKVSYLRKVGK